MPQRNSFWPEPSSWGDELDAGGYDDTFPFLSGDPYRSPLTDTMESYSYTSLFPTAASKQSSIISVLGETNQRDWIDKPVKCWTAEDVMYWAMSVIDEQGMSEYEDLKLDQFRVEGMKLCGWSEDDFLNKDPVFGSILFHALQEKLSEETNKSAYHRLYDDKYESKYLPPFPTLKLNNDRLSPSLGDSVSSTLTELKVPTDHLYYTSSLDSLSERSDSYSSTKSEDSIQDRSQVKKKRGRPVGNRSKRKTEKKCGRLWEFIRDLLLKPEYCPSLICWENHDEGVFRFVRSDKVAELWGNIKENPKMTYEKLSRAMRYYYKSKVLQPVFGRRLVYKFGPTARGWQTDNPNFRHPIPCE